MKTLKMKMRKQKMETESDDVFSWMTLESDCEVRILLNRHESLTLSLCFELMHELFEYVKKNRFPFPAMLNRVGYCLYTPSF
jgi:hypothetical protein